jgi:hypothetical protein
MGRFAPAINFPSTSTFWGAVSNRHLLRHNRGSNMAHQSTWIRGASRWFVEPESGMAVEEI